MKTLNGVSDPTGRQGHRAFHPLGASGWSLEDGWFPICRGRGRMQGYSSEDHWYSPFIEDLEGTDFVPLGAQVSFQRAILLFWRWFTFPLIMEEESTKLDSWSDVVKMSEERHDCKKNEGNVNLFYKVWWGERGQLRSKMPALSNHCHTVALQLFTSSVLPQAAVKGTSCKPTVFSQCGEGKDSDFCSAAPFRWHQTHLCPLPSPWSCCESFCVSTKPHS